MLSIIYCQFFPLLYHRLKLFMIAHVIGTHDTVPDIEVEAEVARHVFVVHVVMRGSIAPQGMDAPSESAPHDLIAGMASYIEH